MGSESYGEGRGQQGVRRLVLEDGLSSDSSCDEENRISLKKAVPVSAN